MSETGRLTRAFQEALNSSGNPADDWVQVGRGFLGEAIDHMEWLEKGLAEWRSLSVIKHREARMRDAQARIAVHHLQAVLNQAGTHAEQRAADTAARDWLASIGSEPT